MAADVKFSINKAASDQFLIPATVSEELEKKFLKKAKSSSIKLIPVSFLVSAVVLGILFVLVYFLKRVFISFMAIFCVFFPIYAIYDAFATAKAIKKQRKNRRCGFSEIHSSGKKVFRQGRADPSNDAR